MTVASYVAFGIYLTFVALTAVVVVRGISAIRALPSVRRQRARGRLLAIGKSALWRMNAGLSTFIEAVRNVIWWPFHWTRSLLNTPSGTVNESVANNSLRPRFLIDAGLMLAFVVALLLAGVRVSPPTVSPSTLWFCLALTILALKHVQILLSPSTYYTKYRRSSGPPYVRFLTVTVVDVLCLVGLASMVKPSSDGGSVLLSLRDSAFSLLPHEIIKDLVSTDLARNPLGLAVSAEAILIYFLLVTQSLRFRQFRRVDEDRIHS